MERAAPIVSMVSSDVRDASVADRRVPGAGEGDRVVGAIGHTAVSTLVERTTRFVLILGLPEGNKSAPLADTVIEHTNSLRAMTRTSLTWDQNSEMANYAALMFATQCPSTSNPSPWEHGSNENTNGLLRQYFPNGTDLSVYTQGDLDQVALRLNTRPRKTLGFQTPADTYDRAVALTG